VLTKTLITIGIFFSLFSYASADYEVFDVNPIPANVAMPSALYGMGGFSSGLKWTVEYVADATVTQFDRLTLPFCRSGGANGGVIDLEIRSSTTTGPIVASSSLTVNSGNVWNTGCGVSIVNGTTSTWVLNQNVQWVSGVTFYFIFYARGTTGTYYFSDYKTAGNNGISYETGSVPASPARWDSMKGYALGIAPVTYNASSSNVVCDTFDIGCYISQGLAWAFYPDPADIEQFQNLSLASSSPFGYIYDMDDALQSFMTGLNATTSSFKITLDMTTLKNTAHVFDGVSTSSITVFDICWVNRSMGELPANSFRDKFLPMIVYMMWIGLGWLFYSVAHKVF